MLYIQITAFSQQFQIYGQKCLIVNKCELLLIMYCSFCLFHLSNLILQLFLDSTSKIYWHVGVITSLLIDKTRFKILNLWLNKELIKTKRNSFCLQILIPFQNFPNHSGFQVLDFALQLISGGRSIAITLFSVDDYAVLFSSSFL